MCGRILRDAWEVTEAGTYVAGCESCTTPFISLCIVVTASIPFVWACFGGQLAFS